MFKLYANIGNWKLLDVSAIEGDIIDTIGEYIEENTHLKFLIMLSTEEGDDFYRSITSVDDYFRYQEEYNKRIKSENIMELKQDMMNSIYGEEPKVKKFKKN